MRVVVSKTPVNLSRAYFSLYMKLTLIKKLLTLIRGNLNIETKSPDQGEDLMFLSIMLHDL